MCVCRLSWPVLYSCIVYSVQLYSGCVGYAMIRYGLLVRHPAPRPHTRRIGGWKEKLVISTAHALAAFERRAVASKTCARQPLAARAMVWAARGVREAPFRTPTIDSTFSSWPGESRELTCDPDGAFAARARRPPSPHPCLMTTTRHRRPRDHARRRVAAYEEFRGGCHRDSNARH